MKKYNKETTSPAKKRTTLFIISAVTAIIIIAAVLILILGPKPNTQPQAETTTEPTTPFVYVSSIPLGTTLSWDAINSIPVAKDTMTENELRHICLDYMRLQLTFSWKPSKNFTFFNGIFFGVDSTYGGLPYVNSSFGNLYKVIDYYDPNTGILDLSDGVNTLKIFGNQCAASTVWAWNRVSNTINFGGTIDATQKNGCIPVGKYTYDHSIAIFDQTPTTGICAENGEQVMYESYARLKPADGIVYSQGSAGHLRMISAMPNIVRNPDGTIDGEKSTITYMDQAKKWNEQIQANGEPYTIQGGLDATTTFQKLYHKGYLPFTIAELKKQSPVEEGTASLDYTGESISVAQLKAAKITGNYAVSSVRIIVTDAQGSEVYNKSTHTNSFQYTYPMGAYLVEEDLTAFAGTDCTIKVLCFIGNGEEVVAYTGTLTT